VSEVRFPEGFRLEPLCRAHPREHFDRVCSSRRLARDPGASESRKTPLGHQSAYRPVGWDRSYYTLATGQVDFSDLPSDLARQLPRRMLPVAILAWLGISKAHQSQDWAGSSSLRLCSTVMKPARRSRSLP